MSILRRGASQRGRPTGPDDIGEAYVLTTSYGVGETKDRVNPAQYQSWAENGYKGNSIVAAVLNVRIMLFSEASFVLRDIDTKETRWDDALSILETPWPGGTTGDLLSIMESDVSLAGNNYLTVLDGEIVRIPPHLLDIVTAPIIDSRGQESPRRDLVGYLYSPDGVPSERSMFFAPGEIAHYRPLPDPMKPWLGMSWLTPVVREINNDIAMGQYSEQFFANAAVPNLLITYREKLNDKVLERTRDAVRAKHGGIDQAFQTMVLDNGADVTVIGNSFEQISFASVRAAGETRIAAAAGVPPMIVGLKEGLQASTLANYREALDRFANLTLRPLWRNACGSLSSLVSVPDGARLWYDTTDIAALREAETERAAIFQTKAATASTLIQSGYKSESIPAAVEAADLKLLQHTGLVPVQLYEPKAKGEGAAPPGGPPGEPEDETEESDEPAPVEEPGGRSRKPCEGCGDSDLFDADRLADSHRHLAGKHDQRTHAGGKALGAATPYAGSGTKDDPYRTPDPLLAAKFLGEDKYVQLEDTHQASTMLDEVARMVEDAEAKGEKAPVYDLCKASVPGTNLFCAESKGIKRIEMPQLSGKPVPGSKADLLPKNAKGEVDIKAAFVQNLHDKGMMSRPMKVDAAYLRASQNELVGRQVVGMRDALERGTLPAGSIIVTKDRYVVDGHHRWAANIAYELKRGGSRVEMDVEMVDADIITVLREAWTFAEEMGIPPKSGSRSRTWS